MTSKTTNTIRLRVMGTRLRVMGVICFLFAVLNVAFFISLGQAYNLAAAAIVAGAGIFAFATARNINAGNM